MNSIKRIIPLLILLLALAGCQQASTAAPSTPTASPILQQETPVPTQTGFPPTETASPTPLPTQAATVQAPTASAEPSATAEPSPTATEEPPVPVSGRNTPQPQEPPPSTAGCQDVAAFFNDVTVPDDTAFQQSVEFDKVWRIRNEGTCTWDGYQLVWAGGDVFDAPLANPISLTAPGELVDISVPMRSPNQGGVFTSYWEFENTTGQRFGVNSGGVDLIWTRISVSWFPEGESQPGSQPLPAPSGGCTVEQNPGYVDQLLTLINNARQQNNLPTLTLDDRLSAAAFAHSSDMACQDFVDHTGSDGSNWKDRIQAAGYSFSYATENIYVGDPAFGGDAQGAFNWWMNSQIHRDNILSTKVTQIGIGYAYSTNSTYKGNYTLDFAKP